MKKAITVFVAVTIGALAGCSGLGGTGQGEECSGPNDTCSANLTCQPIKGRNKSYCCPTPPESSDYQNCHSVP